MKALIAIALVTCLAGCRPATNKSVAEKYTIQVMEVVAPPDMPPTAWPDFVWANDLTHLQGDLSQYIRCRIWAGDDLFAEVQTEDDFNAGTGYADAQVMSDSAKKILRMPGTKKTEYPLIQLSVGERVLNDQTETFEFQSDYEIVDGKTVFTEKEIYKTGFSIDIDLIKVDTVTSTYRLKLYSGYLKGYDAFTLSNGDEIEFPYTEARSSDSEFIQPLNSWNMIRRGIIQNESHIIFIRILPSSSAVEPSTSGTVSNDWNFLD